MEVVGFHSNVMEFDSIREIHNLVGVEGGGTA